MTNGMRTLLDMNTIRVRGVIFTFLEPEKFNPAAFGT